MTPKRILGYGTQETENDPESRKKANLDQLDPTEMSVNEILFSRWSNRVYFVQAKWDGQAHSLPAPLVMRKDSAQVSNGSASVPLSRDSQRKKAAHFIPSSQFAGPKKGYCFKNGRLGLGYYKEERPHPRVVTVGQGQM